MEHLRALRCLSFRAGSASVKGETVAIPAGFAQPSPHPMLEAGIASIASARWRGVSAGAAAATRVADAAGVPQAESTVLMTGNASPAAALLARKCRRDDAGAGAVDSGNVGSDMRSPGLK